MELNNHKEDNDLEDLKVRSYLIKKFSTKNIINFPLTDNEEHKYTINYEQQYKNKQKHKHHNHNHKNNKQTYINQEDLHYKLNLYNPSKNYANSSYNKSYYINPEKVSKHHHHKKNNHFYNNNESNSSYINKASTNKSSDSESSKSKVGEFLEMRSKKKNAGVDSLTETDNDSFEDFVESLGSNLANFICSQKGSR
jgi:hypothetical protein